MFTVEEIVALRKVLSEENLIKYVELISAYLIAIRELTNEH